MYGYCTRRQRDTTRTCRAWAGCSIPSMQACTTILYDKYIETKDDAYLLYAEFAEKAAIKDCVLFFSITIIIGVLHSAFRLRLGTVQGERLGKQRSVLRALPPHAHIYSDSLCGLNAWPCCFQKPNSPLLHR